MAILTVGPTGRDYTTVQAALNAAVAGDILKLDANHLFTENITLPNKGVLGSDIVVTTSATSGLPAAGVRTNPSFAALMPKIQSTGAGVSTVRTAVSANHYKFQHVEFPEVPSGFNAIIMIGWNDTTQQFYSQEPTHITIDQCILHGGPVCGQKRGIETHGRYITITNNYIYDIKSVGQDSQAIMGNNGHGPLTVTNNYLSCGTEGFLLGGSDPPLRTFMTVFGTPTTTRADVTCTETGHTLSELMVGQGISILVGGEWTFTTLSSKTGTGTSGSVTFPALSAPPDVPGGIRGGVVLGMEGSAFGLTFRKNYVRNEPLWINGVLPMPTNVAAIGSTASGSLPAGTHYYTVQAFNDNGYQGADVRGSQSAEVSATIGATGKVTITWGAVTGAAYYRVWYGTAPASKTKYATTSSLTYVDDGAAMTAGTPSSTSKWSVKNLFELKACHHAQIDSNIFEYHWKGVDLGYAVWLKSVNQSGSGQFVQTKDVVFEKNIIRHCDGFLVVHGIERPVSTYGWPGPLTNLTVRNNLLYDSGPTWGQGFGIYALNISNGINGITIDHNTLVHIGDTGSAGMIVTNNTQHAPMTGLVLTNNLMKKGKYGIINSAAFGTAALDLVTSGGYTFSKNAIADAASGGSGGMGAANFYAASAAWEAEFVAYSADGQGADYHLDVGSPWHNAGLDGKDIGADIDLVMAATVNVVVGAVSDDPPPIDPPVDPPEPPDPPAPRAYRRKGRFW